MAQQIHSTGEKGRVENKPSNIFIKRYLINGTSPPTERAKGKKTFKKKFSNFFVFLFEITEHKLKGVICVCSCGCVCMSALYAVGVAVIVV